MTNINTFGDLDEIFRIYCLDKAVIDIGGMNGDENAVFPIDKIKQQARSVTCVDANKNENVDIQGIEFIQSKIQDFDTDKKYQIVFCGEVIEHIADQQAFLTKVRSLLSPDGKVIVTTPNSSALSDFYQIVRTGADPRQDRIFSLTNGVYESGHVVIHNIATLQHLFDSVDMRITDVFYKRPVGGNIFKQMLRDAILSWRPHLSSQIVVVAEAFQRPH
jgi:trans-aconitate methyltransferase